MTLKELKIGESAVIDTVGGEGALRQHFLDMGLIPGERVTLVKFAPMGDPMELQIHGYELTLRLDDAARIAVTPAASAPAAAHARRESKMVEHPGLGEGGRYHTKKGEHPVPEGTTLTFALAGNQNCGKTTLFNQLTGSNQHVGNFPGVTVDQKAGVIKGTDHQVVDLPGIYSIRPYTQEEIVTRDFILKSRPDAIINIVDATNMERNLYLTLQLLTLQVPTVIALNMMDELVGNGGSVDVQKMSEAIGVPVVPISAAKNQGITELVDTLIDTASRRVTPKVQDFCPEGPVHRCIHAVCHIIEDHAQRINIARRFCAMKLIEGEQDFFDALELSQNEKELIEHTVIEMEHETGLDRNAALADMRYNFIEKVCSECVVKAKESREHRRSMQIDKVLTHRIFAIPLFIAIMGLVFFLTFNVVGAFLSNVMSYAIDGLTLLADRALTAYGINPVVHSLVIDGIFAGVGSVVSFLPLIVTLFFFLSILEDSGYMARVAFVMDKLLRKIGLSGRSFVPMLVGFGCSVPAIMATRTLSSNRDRKMTILLTPFMSCSAKIPIYTLFAAAFFPGHELLVMLALYFGGILVGILVALVLKNTAFKGNPVPFVMELPNYRFPSAKSVVLLMWEKAKDFLTRAFTVIFMATVIIWFMQTFDTRLNVVENSADSILAALGRLVSPIFAPLGFGDWRMVTALVSGFTAKEAVVSTFGVILGVSTEQLGIALHSLFTTASAASFLAFCLLYTPCVAAVSTIKTELKSGWKTVGIVFAQCLVAWLAAFMVYHVGLLLT